MTVASQTSRAAYLGDGSTKAFTIPFYFLADAHVSVAVRAASGTETLLTLGADYSVTGSGNPAGGTVTLTTAPLSGASVTVVRNVPATQEIDYQPNDPFPANTHEMGLDKLTMLAQQIYEQLGRAIRISASSGASVADLVATPAERAQKILAFDSAGNPVAITNNAVAAAASEAGANAAKIAAQAAQGAAEGARDQTLAVYDNFDDRYLGAKASDPTTDNDGNALLTGALYFNTTSFQMRVWNGTAWLVAYLPAASYVLKSGDTMSGNLTVSATNAVIAIDKKASGQASGLMGSNGGAPRWQIDLGNGAAETGSSSGSDFSIYRISDAGNYNQVLVVLRNSGDVFIGPTRLNNGDGSLEVNITGNGDRYAYVDLHAHGAAGANDFSARVIRSPGQNGELDLVNTGSGWLRILPGQGAFVQVGLSGQNNVLFVARQNNGDEGGEIQLERCVTNTTLAGNIIIDQNRNSVRIIENGGSFRGVYIDIPSCAINGGSPLTHIHNVGAHIAAQAFDAIGTYGFFKGQGNMVSGPGSTYPGSSLSWTNTGLAGGPTPPGTWVCVGSSNGGNTQHATMYKRIA